MSTVLPSDNMVKVIICASIDAADAKYQFLTPEQWLRTLLILPKARQIIRGLGLDIFSVKATLEDFIETAVPKTNWDGELHISTALSKVIMRARLQAGASGREFFDCQDVILAIYDEKCFASDLLRSGGVDRLGLLELVSHGLPADISESEEERRLGEAGGGILREVTLQAIRKQSGSVLESFRNLESQTGSKEKVVEIPRPAEDKTWDISDFSQDEIDSFMREIEDEEPEEQPAGQIKRGTLLESVSTDLTAMASEGRLDPFIGRSGILKRVIQVLLRRKKNNPILVGEPGVGKTAVVNGLAELIVAGEVPGPLLNCRILSLNVSQIIAGTKFHGEFEDKMKRLLKEMEAEEDLIVFIDEIHQIVGAGSDGGSSVDAANILKPVLSEGSVRFMGATTYEDYRKRFERDSALVRRFQKIDVPETDGEESFKILKGLRESYEKFHKTQFTDDSLRAMVELSARVLNDRFLPDRAIDLMDEVGAANSMERRPSPKIKREHVEKTVASMSGKKQEAAAVDMSQLVSGLEEKLRAKIFGQDAALHEVIRAVKRGYAGFKRQDKPVASFLFAGTTGVGKTELAKVLADSLAIPLLRFDMSEYQEKHTVSKLFGAPPGYVGYDEGGLMTEAVRKNPSCVLLLDEIEKAHGDIYNSLLQIMDYATLTDNAGRKANFSNVILVMTSNAGANEFSRRQSGFGEWTSKSSVLEDAIRRTFTPEFRNRLDKIVYFSPLTPETVRLVVKKCVDELSSRLASRHVSVEISGRAVDFLAKIGFSRDFGARETSRIVEERLEALLLDEILSGSLKNGGKALINIDDNDVLYLAEKEVTK